MANSNRISSAADEIRKLWEKHGIKNKYRALGFCLSLIPIPGIQQAGIILDRKIGDKEFEAELTKLWKAIKAANDQIDKLDNIEDAISAIAETVKEHSSLLKQCERFSNRLAKIDSVFVLETERNSYQQLVGSSVEAAKVLIAARQNSVNTIEDTKISSPRTHLHATDGSKNYINRTSFSDTDGQVRMEGISTQGHVSVTGNSVAFHSDGSGIIFDDPNIATGQCSICNASLKVDRRQLVGHDFLQCPVCFSKLALHR